MKNKLYKKIINIIKNNRSYENICIDICYDDIKNIIKDNKNVILLDVRSPQEYREMHLNNSINIPLYNLEDDIENSNFDKESVIIVYCQSGIRSKKASNVLIKKGFNKIYNLKGGLDAM